VAAIVTTEGTTWFATGVTAHAAAAELPELALVLGELAVLVVQPATTPPITSNATGAIRGRRRAAVSFRSVNRAMITPKAT
jgi:hypothetical protein